MTTEVIRVWNIDDLEDLMKALINAEQTAASMGYHPSIVFPNMRRVALVSETLSDGSKVLNLIFSESSMP
jgi:predicted transcriptional regulator